MPVAYLVPGQGFDITDHKTTGNGHCGLYSRIIIIEDSPQQVRKYKHNVGIPIQTQCGDSNTNTMWGFQYCYLVVTAIDFHKGHVPPVQDITVLSGRGPRWTGVDQ